MNQARRRLATVSFLALTALTCAAQTVYKCESKGAVTYSHEPCMGAKVVDTTPTQGLDKSSGSSRKGADVRQVELEQGHGRRAATASRRDTGAEGEAPSPIQAATWRSVGMLRLDCTPASARGCGTPRRQS